MERVKGLRGGIILNVELRISDWGGTYRAEARGRPIEIGRVALLRSVSVNLAELRRV